MCQLFESAVVGPGSLQIVVQRLDVLLSNSYRRSLVARGGEHRLILVFELVEVLVYE